MKKINSNQHSVIPLVLGLFTLASCHTMADMNDMDAPEMDITYPAAYVINGEGNSISVIELSSNEVKETISLGETSAGGHNGGTMGSGVAWPHHIYLNPLGNQLAIGVPGTDLSAGHSGGMRNMPGKAVIVNARTGAITKTVELPAMNHNAAFALYCFKIRPFGFLPTVMSFIFILLAVLSTETLAAIWFVT